METPSLYVLAFTAGAMLAFVVLARAIESVFAPRASPPGSASRARILQGAGHLLGVFFITAAVVSGCVEGVDWRHDLLWTSVYGATAVVLLSLVGRLGVRVLLHSALPAEIARDNQAAGLVAGAHLAATGILLSSCLVGTDWPTLGVSLVFFVIAQATLALFVVLFRALTAYDDTAEVLKENVAAAVSYAGITLALALIVGHAADGEFTSWTVSLQAYALALVFALALYPVRQIVVQAIGLRAGLTMRGGRLDSAIGAEGNTSFAALEASAYLATAFLVNHVH